MAAATVITLIEHLFVGDQYEKMCRCNVLSLFVAALDVAVHGQRRW
jgi:hypothetical protein